MGKKVRLQGDNYDLTVVCSRRLFNFGACADWVFGLQDEGGRWSWKYTGKAEGKVGGRAVHLVIKGYEYGPRVIGGAGVSGHIHLTDDLTHDPVDDCISGGFERTCSRENIWRNWAFQRLVPSKRLKGNLQVPGRTYEAEFIAPAYLTENQLKDTSWLRDKLEACVKNTSRKRPDNIDTVVDRCMDLMVAQLAVFHVDLGNMGAAKQLLSYYENMLAGVQ